MINTTMIRIAYQLPAEPQSPLAAWIPDTNSSIRFPEDRAHQEKRNRAEFAAKSAAGLLKRRPRQES